VAFNKKPLVNIGLVENNFGLERLKICKYFTHFMIEEFVAALVTTWI